MTTFTFPTLNRGPQSMGVQLVANTAVFRSPLSGTTQTLARPGSRLGMTVTFARRGEPDRSILKGFLAGLYGQEHLLTYHDPSHVQRGALGGTPIVDGGSQVGQAIDISGGPTSQNGWLLRGDHMAFDNGTYLELKIVTADVDTDGSGDATIPIYPEIHISPATSAPIDITVPILGTWRLAGPNAAWEDEVGDRSTFTFDLEEYI